MSMLGGAGALAVALVLLAAGVGHLRDRRGLRRALAAHRVLPAGMQRPLASILGPVEVALGVGLLVLLATPFPTGDTVGPVGGVHLPTGDTVGPLFLVVALSAALLIGAFTAYLLLVLRRTGGAEEIPCGCGPGTTPVGPWAVARAGLLAGLALLALVGGMPDWAALAGTDPTAGATGAAAAGATAAGGATDAVAAVTPLWAHVLLVVAAGTTLAIAVGALPAARAIPSSLTTLHGAPTHQPSREMASHEIGSRESLSRQQLPRDPLSRDADPLSRDPLSRDTHPLSRDPLSRDADPLSRDTPAPTPTGGHR